MYVVVWAFRPRPGREAEFEAWFQQEHLAERLAVPGFLLGRRHEILEQRLAYRADEIGALLRGRLGNLSGHEIVDIRGIGLLIGIEFAEAAMARRFVAETLRRGVVVNWTLNADRVVRLAPPLIIAEDEIDFAVSAMDDALTAIRKD